MAGELPRERPLLRAGMVGMGMIFDETYRPFLEQAHAQGVYDKAFGVCQVELAAVASKTGKRAEAYRAGERVIVGTSVYRRKEEPEVETLPASPRPLPTDGTVFCRRLETIRIDETIGATA